MRNNDVRKPTIGQYLAYCFGKVLPPELRDWVREDLTGRGATARLVVRVTTPVVLLVAPAYLLPTDIITKMVITLPLVIPFVYFAISLSPVYRRFRLTQHGLDGDLVDARKHEREADDMAAYYARYRGEDPLAAKESD
ncbi:MAG: DUF5313 domain-containing protein [Nocardiaceae bacterium]|nr:DUF5313 domain-containing protein [Nocardiaceae bacterium]